MLYVCLGEEAAGHLLLHCVVASDISNMRLFSCSLGFSFLGQQAIPSLEIYWLPRKEKADVKAPTMAVFIGAFV